MWKLQQVLPNNDLFFSRHRITPKLIKAVKNIYFRQMDTLTRIVTRLWLNAGINQNLSFTVMFMNVSLYLQHKGSHCTSLGCLQLLRGFVYISQDLIFEVPSRDVSKEKLDLNSIQKVFTYSELLSAYKSNLLLWNMFNISPGNGVFCRVQRELGL